MADDDFISRGLTLGAIPISSPSANVGQRPFAIPLVDHNHPRHAPPPETLQESDGFALENLSPETASILLSTTLMNLPGAVIQRTRLGMLRLTLEKIRDGLSLDQTDDMPLSMAGAIIRSAPRMVAASFSHEAGEYRQEELRELADEFIATAMQLGVLAEKSALTA